jgi:hypothetical protein
MKRLTTFIKSDVYCVEEKRREEKRREEKRASLNIISLQIAAAIWFTVVFPQQYIIIRYQTQPLPLGKVAA